VLKPDGLDAEVAGPYDRVDIGNELGVESSRTMPTFNRRWIVILVVVAVVAGGVAWMLFPSANHGPLHVLLVDSPPPTPAPSVAYITGAIEQPGVYPLKRGERLSDLVYEAGGLTTDADVRRLNLAARVADGEHIDVPALATAPESAPKVRMNHASRAELLSLPGLSLQQATAIQESVRKTGPLTSADDLIQRGLCTITQASRFAAMVDWSP